MRLIPNTEKIYTGLYTYVPIKLSSHSSDEQANLTTLCTIFYNGPQTIQELADEKLYYLNILDILYF